MTDTDDVFADHIQTAPRDEVGNLKHISCGGVFNRQNSVVDLAAFQCREHVVELLVIGDCRCGSSKVLKGCLFSEGSGNSLIADLWRGYCCGTQPGLDLCQILFTADIQFVY